MLAVPRTSSKLSISRQTRSCRSGLKTLGTTRPYIVGHNWLFHLLGWRSNTGSSHKNVPRSIKRVTLCLSPYQRLEDLDLEDCFLLLYSTVPCYLEYPLLTGGRKATDKKTLQSSSKDVSIDRNLHDVQWVHLLHAQQKLPT